MTSLTIIIPAYNEANRIGATLTAYHDYFSKLHTELKVQFLVVLNGCTDTTEQVVTSLQQTIPTLFFMTAEHAGKGLAITAGFKKALESSAEYVGFVDADMATRPEYFHALLSEIKECDGAIASRYMRGAQVFPPRPFVKEWGRKIFYHSLVWLLFGMRYKDMQCGAKIFKRDVIEKIVPFLTVRQWAFDVELLYLCKKNNLKIKEVPTVWHDQAESKLVIMGGGLKMLGSLISISPFVLMLRRKLSSKRCAHFSLQSLSFPPCLLRLFSGGITKDAKTSQPMSPCLPAEALRVGGSLSKGLATFGVLLKFSKKFLMILFYSILSIPMKCARWFVSFDRIRTNGKRRSQ